MKSAKTYEISIQHPDWGHFVTSKTSRREAIKFAADLRKFGNGWTDTESITVLQHCGVAVSHKENGEVYNKPFTKKYIDGLKK